MLNVLILDDEEIIRTEVKEFLENFGYAVFEAERPSAAMELLGQQEIDIMVLDIRLPEKDGLEVLKDVKNRYPATEVIMITGHGDSDTVLQSMKLGAFDFFHKPIRLLEIRTAIERTERFLDIQGKLKKLERRFDAVSTNLQRSIADIVGSSKAITQVIDTTLKAAASPDTSVLITGESGCGKELIARVLHYASPRGSLSYVPVNCSAIPDTLIESEFFGHRKGAFTGAIEDKAGYFEVAEGGTLFLDEIGDMPLQAQTKLLRVLEDRKVKRIGGTREIPVNLRVIAATNQDIPEMIAEKTFRGDLYYRINTLEIRIPPLRERLEDIEELVLHFIREFNPRFRKKVTGISPEALVQLQKYDFPGNVRELRGMIERAMILCEGTVLAAESLLIPEKTDMQEQTAPVSSKKQDVPQVQNYDCSSFSMLLGSCDNLSLDLLDSFERDLLNEALKRCKHNKSRTAEMLDISIHALGRRLRRLEIS
ncbi:sigma-54-dependent transcriptional regulator [Spirochaeta dissipatitropha]